MLLCLVRDEGRQFSTDEIGNTSLFPSPLYTFPCFYLTTALSKEVSAADVCGLVLTRCL